MANYLVIRRAICEWLDAQPHDAPLPRMSELAASMPDAARANAYAVCGALVVLERSGAIVMRHGTRSEARGHYAIRVVATGHVHRTKGCPFEAPQQGASECRSVNHPRIGGATTDAMTA